MRFFVYLLFMVFIYLIEPHKRLRFFRFAGRKSNETTENEQKFLVKKAQGAIESDKRGNIKWYTATVNRCNLMRIHNISYI